MGTTMCGIVCAIGNVHHNSQDLIASVASRGPDAQSSHTVSVEGLPIWFHASVLHLRGDEVTPQPHVATDTRDVLIYNGEIFDGLDVSAHENDGAKLFTLLRTSTDPLEALNDIDGPYVFVYFRASTSTLYWTRDPLGRRSLLVMRQANGLLLASTAPHASTSSAEWQEVPALSALSLRLPSANFEPVEHARVYKGEQAGGGLPLPYNPINTAIPTEQELLSVEDRLPAGHADFTDALAEFRYNLQRSIGKRVADIPRLRGPRAPKARIGVLFSGGLDCSVLALMADSFIPKEEAVDLLNVAFENPRSMANRLKLDSTSDPYSTPDRLTGLTTYNELKALRPDRQWNFVQVNVAYNDFMAERQHIVDLMYPSNTAMDLSIAQALYFAAKGQGVLAQGQQEYHSEARVLLSGLGADEQLGGYSRHKKAFGKIQDGAGGDWSALIQELQMDLDRIGSRNLGRDDRVISSLGKEARYPFLAAHVVAYLASLPVHLKVDYRFGDGVGDKMLLRALARQLGLQGAASLAKRAIQFGARSAKMEVDSSKLKGHTALS